MIENHCSWRIFSRFWDLVTFYWMAVSFVNKINLWRKPGFCFNSLSFFVFAIFRAFSDYLYFNKKGGSARTFHAKVARSIKKHRYCLKKGSLQYCAYLCRFMVKHFFNNLFLCYIMTLYKTYHLYHIKNLMTIYVFISLCDKPYLMVSWKFVMELSSIQLFLYNHNLFLNKHS
jgi:hypothetical protein